MALSDILKNPYVQTAAGTGATIGTGLALNKAFPGQPESTQQYSRFTPEIQQNLNSVIQNLLGKQGKTFDFAPISERARTQFQQRTLPSIAERFTAMGIDPSSSSGFSQEVGGAGADLESQLASLESQYGLQQQGQEQDLLKSLLGLGTLENLFRPRQAGFGESFASSTAPAIGKTLALLLLGKATGLDASTLTGLSSLFSGGK